MKKILNRKKKGGGAKLLSSPSPEGILYYNHLLKSGGGAHRITYVPLLTILEDSIPSLEVSVITHA